MRIIDAPLAKRLSVIATEKEGTFFDSLSRYRLFTGHEIYLILPYWLLY